MIEKSKPEITDLPKYFDEEASCVSIESNYSYLYCWAQNQKMFLNKYIFAFHIPNLLILIDIWNRSVVHWLKKYILQKNNTVMSMD